MRGINDAALWRKEYMRQFHGVKTALHSLRVQTAQRLEKSAGTKAAKEMAFHFDLVEEAFQVLNRPEPRSDSNSEELIPGPGRRQFLSDLKHGEVRT